MFNLEPITLTAMIAGLAYPLPDPIDISTIKLVDGEWSGVVPNDTPVMQWWWFT